MNTHRYIVLKATGPNAKVLGSIRGGVLGGAEAFRNVEITAEAATLGTRELNDLRKVPEVIRTAPVMPVMLVQPKVDAAQAQDAPGSAWGVEAVGALTCPFTGAGVTVAVLDSGIDGGHGAFRGKTIVQKDFTGEGDGDNNGHGTHCAGTIFGGEVDGLRIGVAPGVSKALIGKVLNRQGGGNTEQILNGLLWAVQEGANVVSMSIGFNFPGYVNLLVSQGMKVEPATSQALSAYRENVRLFDALADLVRAHSSMFTNAMVVAAAGNESARPDYEIATAPPAAADGFISVGALQQMPGPGRKLGVATFSNARPLVSAPGVSVKSAKAGGGLTSMSGTSMATPHVAGVAALWLEQINKVNPSANIRQLEGRLIGTSSLESISDTERPNAGAGIVQAPPRAPGASS
jgi:subtilisin family serine protease